MSSISIDTNVRDRVFCLFEGNVFERRYFSGGWHWIEHSALNNNLNGKGAVLGPSLVNSSEGVGRLYIRIQAPKFVSSQTPHFETRWVVYNFDPDQTDYSDISNFQIGNYVPITFVHSDCYTNVAISADWKLYGLERVLGSSKPLRLTRYDLDLNKIKQADTGMPAFGDSSVRSHEASVYITEADSGYVRPAVMSDEDVLTTSGGYLYHSDIDMVTKDQGSKQFIDAGAALEDRVFCIRSSNAKLYARRYDDSKNKWVWENHGRPVKRKHFEQYVVGSLRKYNDGVLFMIKPDWGNDDDNFRVYHRWRDSDGGWHWADHGYPDNETLTEIGPAWDDKFFVRTASGALYERHWNPNVQRWAWENHGTP